MELFCGYLILAGGWREKAAAYFGKAAAETIQAAGQGYFPCLFHTLTGAYCPGCGGSRAAAALLCGKLLLSFFYHPLVPYLAFALPFLMLWYGYCRKKKKTFSPKIWKNVLFFGLGLLILNVLVKNYFLLFRGTDVLSMLDQMA